MPASCRNLNKATGAHTQSDTHAVTVVNTLVFPAIEVDGRGGEGLVNTNREWGFTPK